MRCVFLTTEYTQLKVPKLSGVGQLGIEQTCSQISELC